MEGERDNYRHRLCWECRRKLDFDDFCQTNKIITKDWAIDLWQSEHIELLCCSCYYKKFRLMLQRNSKKVLLTGIDNSGKTALINVIRDRRLRNAVNLAPTRGRSIQHIEINEQLYSIWDLGGVQSYRSRWITKKDIIFYSLDEIIYFIDVQDSRFFKESIDYLLNIVNLVNTDEIKNTIEANLKLLIFMHKTDPEVMDDYEILENIKCLTKKINDFKIPFNYEIYNTSIFNFQKNYSESFFSNGEINEFSSLAVNLFSEICT